MNSSKELMKKFLSFIFRKLCTTMPPLCCCMTCWYNPGLIQDMPITLDCCHFVLPRQTFYYPKTPSKVPTMWSEIKCYYLYLYPLVLNLHIWTWLAFNIYDKIQYHHYNDNFDTFCSGFFFYCFSRNQTGTESLLVWKQAYNDKSRAYRWGK